MENETDLFLRLSVALAIGLLMGLERGWETRELGEGSRLAGVRTFALAGMLGALWALLGRELGPVLLGIAFAGFAMIVAVAHVLARQKGTDVGATTLVAILFTFALGGSSDGGVAHYRRGLGGGRRDPARVETHTPSPHSGPQPG